MLILINSVLVIKMNFLFISELRLFIIFINFYLIKNEFDGVYKIFCYSNRKYFNIYKNNLILNDKYSSFFNIIKEDYNSYYIVLSIFRKKRIGVNEKDQIIAYDKNENNY